MLMNRMNGTCGLFASAALLCGAFGLGLAGCNNDGVVADDGAVASEANEERRADESNAAQRRLEENQRAVGEGVSRATRDAGEDAGTEERSPVRSASEDAAASRNAPSDRERSPVPPLLPIEPTEMDHAIQHGDTAAAIALLEDGFDPDHQDANGFSPLHKAARAGHIEIVQALLDHGADVNARARLNIVPLHWAARSNQLEIAKLLVEAGAEVNARGARDDMHTPMSLAATLNYVDVVDYLHSVGGEM